MNKYSVALLACVASMAVAAPAFADVVALEQPGFEASDTIIDFNSAANEQQVGATYSGNGVTFSGTLYGMTNSADTRLFPNNGGGVIASNFLYTQGRTGGLSFTANFAQLNDQLGFLLENWPQQTLSVDLFNGASKVGSFSFAPTTSLYSEFRGLQSSELFDRATFTNTQEVNGFFAIDNFTFGNSAMGAVPEPASWAMMILGMGAVGGALRRRGKVSTTVKFA